MKKSKITIKAIILVILVLAVISFIREIANQQRDIDAYFKLRESAVDDRPTEEKDASTEVLSPEESDIQDDRKLDLNENVEEHQEALTGFTYSAIPGYSGYAFEEVNDNFPFFTDEFRQITIGYEYYSPLDDLGRCGEAYACIGEETMPAAGEQRGEIGMVKPSGWHTAKYPEVIKDVYLYNRCHLIGWQLGAENANEQNLVTGTRYLNVNGMLPFENEVADYVRDTHNHVLYRVTPIYVDSELVCRGVLMEAESIETDDVRFCIYCYNVQPGICIDYATGDSWLEGETVETDETEADYIINIKSGKVHRPECDAVNEMSEKNKQCFHGTVAELKAQGYQPCGNCDPW